MKTPNSNNLPRERHWVCARRMRERRLALGLTQREVVGRLQRRGTQVTNRALSAMENGRGPDIGLLPELAGSLECTVTYLLGLAEDPRSWQPDQMRTAAMPPRASSAGPASPNGPAAPRRLRQNGISAKPAGGVGQ